MGALDRQRSPGRNGLPVMKIHLSCLGVPIRPAPSSYAVRGSTVWPSGACDGSKRPSTVIDPWRARLTWWPGRDLFPPRPGRPVDSVCFSVSLHNCFLLTEKTFIFKSRTSDPLPGRLATVTNHLSLPPVRLREITLSGGSLGSCVDEERSQLRELM